MSLHSLLQLLPINTKSQCWPRLARRCRVACICRVNNTVFKKWHQHQQMNSVYACPYLGGMTRAEHQRRATKTIASCNRDPKLFIPDIAARDGMLQSRCARLRDIEAIGMFGRGRTPFQTAWLGFRPSGSGEVGGGTGKAVVARCSHLRIAYSTGQNNCRIRTIQGGC